jgi:chemotaxis protein MotB
MNNNQAPKVETKKEEPKQGWLLTYADMMTLLFAFFVMMYSMSSPDPVKMSQIQDAMQKEAGKEGIIQSQHEIKQEFEEIVKELDIQDVANVIEDPRGVALEMEGDICFSSGSTELKPTLKAVLNAAAKKILLNKQDYRMVIIEGHTDNAPIPQQLKNIYPTNWELSAARASNVVNYLIKNSVNSGRLQASGYADRWPAGVSWYDVRSGKVNDKIIREQNKTQSQMQKNRRIKIVFTNN